MKQEEDMTLLAKLRNSLRVRLGLIIVIVAAIVLEGGGLMQYFRVKQEASDPRAATIFIIQLVIGLVLVILLIYRAVKSMKDMQRISASNERMESELHIASEIQMSMLPKTFPPFPERSDIDMYASIVPAKEVGGDLYDFLIRDEKLMFCIGDVSGKGVPASLVMAVTRSLFRSISSREKSPRKIVTAMNDAMSDMNDSGMFVTFWLGVLDLASGQLRWCNAGHNAPVLITSGGEVSFLGVDPNVPLAIMPGMSFTEQEMMLRSGDGLFLYTDGVTEAEDAGKALYGEDRMLEALRHSPATAKDRTLRTTESVENFIGDNPRSDDQTILALRYTNPAPESLSERHLVLRNSIDQIPQLAGFMEAVADEAGMDKSMAMNLNLALEEAVSNVILYAYPEGSDGLVEIEAVIRPGVIDFVISDSGKPFDPTAADDPDTTLGVDERGIGGLGIFLVRSIMDSVSYERTAGHNILRMTRKLETS